MSSESALEEDRLARAAALDVGRSFIVQAPAGSGKTELLIQRYLGLLARVDEPEEVLAITFTRKAAQEMQMRVVAALERAAGGVAPEEPHHRITFAAARRVRERDREREWNLAESPGRLRIQTLDALNAGIAAALPLTSGFGGSARIIEDEELTTWYSAAGAATLDWLVAGEASPECAAVENVLTHLGNDTAAYIEHIAGMLATRDQWLPIVGPGVGAGAAADGSDALRQALERNIAARIAAYLEKVRRNVPAKLAPRLATVARHAASNLAGGGSTTLSSPDLLDGLPPASAGHLADWRAIADLLLTQAGRARKSVNRNQGFLPGEEDAKAEALDVLTAIAEHDELCALLHGIRRVPDPKFGDEQWSVLLSLFRLLPLAAAELKRLFADNGVTDFIEVAAAADRALGSADDPGEVALILDHGIRHLLIDEMQDTSIAQYRLLEKLVAGWQPGDGRTLFCVGDPMQSIYRFRDAEVGQFLLARAQGIGDVPLESLVLRRNFRSCPELVEWFNEVFAGTLPPADDIVTGAISYAASVAANHGSGAGHCRVHALVGADAGQEAERGLDVIRQCLADSPSEDSIAVLVRSRAQLSLLLERLRAADIGYRAVEIDRLTDLPEIIELRALTRALCHRSDRIAWLALLRGPLVGLAWSDLHALVRNDRGRTAWELLQDELHVAGLPADAQKRIARVIDALAPFLESHGTRPLRETVERAWYALGGPLLLAGGEQADNAYRFLDVLERNETAGTLIDVAELEALLDRERVSGHAPGDARLQVMTIHKAKGLEFDHVVLYGLGRRSRGDRKSVLSWLALPGAREGGLLVSPIGPRAEIESDPLHAWIEAAGREKDRLEQDRLLYVACTRARTGLHLVGHVETAADGASLRNPPDRTLLGSLWPYVRPVYEAAFARAGIGTPTAPAPKVLRTPVLRRLRDDACLPPVPELPGNPALPRAAASRDAQPVTYDWVSSVARQAGTIVHRWLRRIADGERVAVPGELAAVTCRWAAELGVPAADVEHVSARVADALRRIVADERGRWLLGGRGHAELPVSGLWNGRIESIVIDRVRIDEDGVHWVVDYKTGSHEGGDLARFLEQETERYRPQLVKYAALYRSLTGAPVRAALYFPLLARFLPVELE